MSKSKTCAVVYRWQDGREEIRYTRPIADLSLAREVCILRRTARRKGQKSPYYVRREN